jgi:hypothetical protein
MSIVDKIDSHLEQIDEDFKKQQAMLKKIDAAITSYNKAFGAKWPQVVDAVNNFVENGGIYDASFPPDLLRKIESGVENTAWIYWRLGDKKTYNNMKKALGYIR